MPYVLFCLSADANRTISEKRRKQSKIPTLENPQARATRKFKVARGGTNSNQRLCHPPKQLPPIYGEVARSFSAQMYLMWVPSAGITGCTLLCEMPVPLGVVYWQYSGDTINTGQTTFFGGVAIPEWTNNSGWAWTSGFLQPASFPVWTMTINPL